MDAQTFGFLISLIAVLLNIIVLYWNMRKTDLQHKKTEELAALTANLETQVHRLSVGLNQEISRLNRMKDLTNGVYLAAAKITAKYRWAFVDPSATAGKDTWRDQYLEELVVSRVTVDGSFVEMVAIANVVSDLKLSSLLVEYKLSVPRKEYVSSDEWESRMKGFETSATALHEQIYLLLQKITNKA